MKTNYRITILLLVSLFTFSENQGLKAQYTLNVNLSSTIRPVTHCAIGALYGITEDTPADIAGLVAPLHPNVYTQPARAGSGYQQPYGAAIPVSARITSTTGQVMIRLADICPGWPYQWPGESSWISQVTSVINDKIASGRSNYYGYEIWNEHDGTWQSANGDWYSQLWKPTYDLIRSMDPGAKIIGPSDSYYLHSRMSTFLTYCRDNNCLPDIISWHELQGCANITSNINDYRALESSLGISPREISINEYCHPTHANEGCPGTSAPFIAKFERNKVQSACISWWFTNLPGRLGSLLTSSNQKGGGWWFYKWYGDMTGNMVSVTPPNENSDGIDGFACLDLNAGYASICFGGNNTGTVNVVISGIPSSFGNSVSAKTEYVPWSSKDTPVSGTITVSTTNYTVSNGTITVPVNVTSTLYGYRVYITPVSSASTSEVWLEAECGNVGSLWNVVSDGNASHGQYVTIQSGNNSTSSAPTNSSGYIDYPFTVNQSGTYYLDARVLCPTANDDSYWVRIDGGSWTMWNNITTTSWAWMQFPNTFSLSSGNHTLTFAYREDGAELDKILITNSGSIPTGLGSDANNCGSSCTPTAITPYIQVNGGSWQQTSGVTVSSGSTVAFGPQPTSGGSWSWTGCGVSGTSRQQTFTATSSCTATAIYTNSCGAQSTQNFNITVNSGGGSGGTDVWLEAECGSVGSLWNTVSDGNASNGQYVTIQSGNNSTSSAPTNSAGYIDFPFSISQSGTYYMNARVLCPTGNDDSYWVRMDGGSWVMWNNITTSSWAWMQFPNTFSLSSGSHTLTFAYREDGAELDKINLSGSSTLPTGQGSAANNCSGGGSTGSYDITVRALGTSGSEQISLTVGGTTVQSWTLTTSYASYTATTSNSGAINVEFTNDNGTSRDVQVDYIVVAGTTEQAEDQATNTGVWQNSQCGGSYSEWLQCNGYISFPAYKSAKEPMMTNSYQDISIYPNPAKDMLTVLFPGVPENNGQISIYNSMGTLVRTMKIEGRENNIDLSKLPAGLYIIRVGNGNYMINRKFIKQ